MKLTSDSAAAVAAGTSREKENADSNSCLYDL